jgi:hypothetical protein
MNLWLLIFPFLGFFFRVCTTSQDLRVRKTATLMPLSLKIVIPIITPNCHLRNKTDQFVIVVISSKCWYGNKFDWKCLECLYYCISLI